MDSEAVVTRRRGAVLERAILDAAWDVLTESGYDAFTLEAVAHRAGTSRTVLARRWSDRAELRTAALRRRGHLDPIEPLDTGSLRDDVLVLLGDASLHLDRYIALLYTSAAGEGALRDAVPARLRDVFLSDAAARMEDAWFRAIDRGEAPQGSVDPWLLALPFDLFSAEVLMTRTAPGALRLAWIVDEVFMPLVRGRLASVGDAR
ncbi:TetR/AcrR family transcriptional regulator [Demequina capsici]|uniref:TetR/AcrR family transcriptional regulator n=1 Tax=Demequina capsici TaxID=3075620 RepID=A0AA96F9P3_9MICO|nr:TetR/AcrR family transcriptional regulator [Demequina sp. OYTSA14]WNM25367.1 TetR/AcrR family transcriptional regulator [Demequina sp. OYTSA14]